MKIQEVIVVEGRDDVRAINQAVEAVCITTSGLGLNDEIRETIRTAGRTRGVIIFTDPDHPGEKIRKMVKALVPDAKEAFLPRAEATNPKTGKFGIEFARPESIRRALAEAKSTLRPEDIPDPYTQEDLVYYGLTGQADSSALRNFLANRFGIGHANGKQFLKKMNGFALDRKELEAAIGEWHKSHENQ